MQTNFRGRVAFHFARFLLVTVAFCAAVPSSHATTGYATIGFNTSAILVSQDTGMLQVAITRTPVSGPGTSSIDISVLDGTALKGIDFGQADHPGVSTTSSITWTGTDPNTKYLAIPIFRTGAHVTRTFQVAIVFATNAAVPSSSSTCDITIDAVPYLPPSIHIDSAKVNGNHYLTVRGTTTPDAAIISNSVKINGKKIPTTGTTSWSARTKVSVPGTYRVVATTRDVVGYVVKTSHTYTFN